MHNQTIENQIDELILQGKGLTFENNCYRESHGSYTAASEDFQAWKACVEDLIIENYGENSAPHRLYESFDPIFLKGYTKGDFDREHNKLIGALKACKRIRPKRKPADIDKEVALQNILNRFHAVTVQLRSRYSGRPTLDVTDEYDVQDLLHSLLKLHFNDIRKEEWTPSYAGGSSRMDFLLKEEQTVIEVKKTRVGLGDKELGKQLIEDKERYKAHPDCRRLICFTYDPEGRITNPKGIQNDLNLNSEGFMVEIIIKPEH